MKLVKIVRLPDVFLPFGIRRSGDEDTTDLQLWPARVFNRKGLIKSLEELSLPGSKDYEVLMNHLNDCEQGRKIRRAALPILYKDCSTLCTDGCDCRHCSVPLDRVIIIGPREYFHVRDVYSFEKKKAAMEERWSVMMRKHRNSQPGSVGYDIICHLRQLMLAMEQCGAPMNVDSDMVQVTNITPSPTNTNKKRQSMHGDNSSSKKPKHGNHNDEIAEAVGGVDDVSFCGNGPSIRSQSSSSSSQSDFLASGDDVSSLSGGECSTLSETSSSGKSHHAMKRAFESQALKVGSRLVLSTTTPIADGHNTRTCLLDAVMTLLQYNAHANKIRNSIIASMPPTGDTPISVATKALSRFGMSLQTVTSTYHHRSGGIAYNVLQEHQCKLILRMKLTNKSNRVSYHVVAWDGTFIHDRPYKSKVSKINDRRTILSCREVFSKLYRKFKDWRIIHVYRLVEFTTGDGDDKNHQRDFVAKLTSDA